MTNLTKTEQLIQFYIPKRYWECDKTKINEQTRKQINQALQERKGIFLHGQAGTGKTYILYSILKEFISINGVSENESGLYSVNSNFQVVDMPTFSSKIKSYVTREEDPEENIYPYKTCQNLFIDDLGAEKMTDFLFENVYQIINYRYNNLLPCYITSNYSLKEVSEKINDRIASRIAEMCVVIKLEGDDRRI